ncbi:hypothetical protein CBR56_07725 [Bacillus thuringiensis]|uniref:hypothetical protein n=1 Tax=Bacillus tropicus TaxID=2026188 RepID=UPI000B42EC14|nr:hypothetical protein [Bacillus tropicus]MED3037261.1 hypothetical protein [Bacillus tropicus]OTX85107.1 hypothetical protein BK728_10795 [Bacillus thuringiensis serovar chanpaisis]PNK31483.1 hypothetical protein CBR56_07725 [Bacillus thuringiensis]
MAKTKRKVINTFEVANLFLLNGGNGIIFLEIPSNESTGSQATFDYVNTLNLEDLHYCKTLTIINSRDKSDQDYIFNYKHNEKTN